MTLLGAWSLGLGSAAFVLYLVIRNNAHFSAQLYAYRTLFLVWTGTMIGAWLSFGIRRSILTIRDLSRLETDMVDPPLRLVFTGLIAGTLAMVFICEMVRVEIGGLHSAELFTLGSRALLIGILMGVSEQALPTSLTRRASQFITELGGPR
jgi:hypothetical protein